MANLAKTAVTVLDSWFPDSARGGQKLISRRVSMALTGQGSVTNKITPAALDMASIVSCDCLTKSDNTVVIITAPSADGSALLLNYDASDVTGTYVGTVTGVPISQA